MPKTLTKIKYPRAIFIKTSLKISLLCMLPVIFHFFRHAFARTAEMNVSFTTKTAFNQIRRENPGGDALNKLKTRRIGYRNRVIALKKSSLTEKTDVEVLMKTKASKL